MQNLNQIRSTANLTNSSFQAQNKVPLKDEDFTLVWKSIVTERNCYYKFCSYCGWKLKNAKSRLIDHYKAQHQNMKMEPSWLKNGETPTDCIYFNWNEFKSKPYQVELQLKKSHIRNSGGRKVNVTALFAPKKKLKKLDIRNKFLNYDRQYSQSSSFLELIKKQQEFEKANSFRKKFSYKSRHLVLKEYHLACIRKERFKYQKLEQERNIQIPQIIEQTSDLEVIKLQYEKQIVYHKQQADQFRRDASRFYKSWKNNLKILYSQQDKLKQMNYLNRQNKNVLEEKAELQKQMEVLRKENFKQKAQIDQFKEWQKVLEQNEQEYLQDHEKLKLQCKQLAEKEFVNQKKEFQAQLLENEKILNDYKNEINELSQNLKQSQIEVQNQKTQIKILDQKYKELERSKEGYQKELYRAQNLTENIGGELQYLKERMEWILFDKDSEGDQRIKEIEEFRIQFKNNKYLRNILYRVNNERNKKNKKIASLENELKELKSQNQSNEIEMLIQRNQQSLNKINEIMNFCKQKLYDEKTYVNKNQQSVKLIQFIENITQQYGQTQIYDDMPGIQSFLNV